MISMNRFTCALLLRATEFDFGCGRSDCQFIDHTRYTYSIASQFDCLVFGGFALHAAAQHHGIGGLNVDFDRFIFQCFIPPHAAVDPCLQSHPIDCPARFLPAFANVIPEPVQRSVDPLADLRGALAIVPAKPNINTTATIAALLIGILLGYRNVIDLTDSLVQPAALQRRGAGFGVGQ